MTEKSHIFISYKSEQRDYAFLVRDKLQEWGYTTWVDVDRIFPGDVWAKEIDTAARTCSACLGIMTPRALNSPFVTNEWDIAIGEGRLFIPLMFEKCDSYMYRHIQYVDFTSGNHEVAFAQLKRGLSREQNQFVRDKYQPYFKRLLEIINAGLTHTVIRTLRDDQGLAKPLNLTSRPSQDAVDEKTAKHKELSPLLVALGIKDELPQSFDDFSKAFEYYQGRVLLLGEPGAGKTTTLYHYARDAVIKRLVDKDAPIPILGIVSRWDAENQPSIEEWLVTEPDSPLDATSIIREGKAILLLDGLDELGREKPLDSKKLPKQTYDPRMRFVEALNQVNHCNQVIVTSRTRDYEEIGKKLSLNGAIQLQPLTDDQIQAYLSDHLEIYRAIQEDERLRDLARTPLLLSLIAFAFDRLEEDLKAKGDLRAGDVRDAIFLAYCKQRYEHEARKKNADLPFSYQEMMDILGKLALSQVIDLSDDQIDLNYLDEKSVDITKFTTYMVKLNILALESKSFRFIHLLLRDTLAYTFALPRIWELDLRRGEVLSADSIIALGLLRDARAVTPLAAMLTEEYRPAFTYVIGALGEIADPSAVEPLIDLLSDVDPDVVAYAVWALADIGDDRAVEPLLKLLEYENTALDDAYNVRLSSIVALDRFNDPRSIPYLLMALSDEEAEVYFEAYQALKNFGINLHKLDELINIVENEEVRKELAQVLGNGKEIFNINSYNLGTNFNHVELRKQVINALGKIGDKRAINPLIAALQKADASERVEIVWALGNFTDDRIVPTITGLLTDIDEPIQLRLFRERVCDDAFCVLKEIGTPEALQACANWIAAGNEYRGW
ncbi:MAG: hypothetical protein OHK0046_16730 [Anaerolineae bacterium]